MVIFQSSGHSNFKGSDHTLMHNDSAIDYQFKGFGNRRAYFEVWYLKFILDSQTTLSLIPSLHRREEVIHGHLQIVLSQGDDVMTRSFTYPAADLSMGSPFHFKLGCNDFTSRQITVDESGFRLLAHIDSVRPYPGNIMGPFRFFHPIMPCNHGLLVTGGNAAIDIQSTKLTGSFTARLYVEKDWGDTFPERYIWAHAEFPDEDCSLFFSAAAVAVGNVKFPGFIANIVLDGRDHTFATWNLSALKITGNSQDIQIAMSNQKMKVILRTKPRHTVSLQSPDNGLMESAILEALSAPLSLILEDESGRIRKFHTNRASVEYHRWFDR